MKVTRLNEHNKIKLSNSQTEAVASIKDWFVNKRSLIYTLSGGAGTGKTFLTNHIIKTIFRGKRVLVSAPTHKAVRVIEAFTRLNGKTAHSLHGLRPNFNLSNFNIDKVKFESLGINKFNNYDVIIMDESSMIGKDLHKLTKIRALQYNTNVMFVGDKLQLLPVKEDTISEVFNSQYNYNLTDIIRQADTNEIIELLIMLRYDVLNNTATFLNFIMKNRLGITKGEGYRVMNLTQFITYIKESFTSDEFDNNISAYRIGTYTNASVNRWNKYVRALLTNSKDLITIGDRLMGYKTIVDEFLSPIILNSNEYLVIKVDYKISDDNFKVFEIEVQDYYSGMIYNIYIVDHTDKTFINYYNKICQLHRNALYGDVIKKGILWKTYYHYKETFMCMIDFDLVYDGSKHANVKREIDYAYAVTIHKLQGSTIDNIIIDGMDICFHNSNKRSPRTNNTNNPNVINNRNRLLYTGLSRAGKTGNILYY